MTVQTIKGFVTMTCDYPKCHEFLEDTNFNDLFEAAKELNWKYHKDQNNKWVHFCPDCRLQTHVNHTRGRYDVRTVQTKREPALPGSGTVQNNAGPARVHKPRQRKPSRHV
jgi:hypothetical protein